MRRPGAVTPTQSASAVVAVAVIVLALGVLTVAAAVLPSGRERGPVGLYSGTGSPYQLIVTAQPAPSTAAGSKFAVTVSVEDALGEVVTTDSSTAVMLAVTPGTGAAGAVLTCDTNPVTDLYGVSTFGCSIGAQGVNYQLTATGGGLRTVQRRLGDGDQAGAAAPTALTLEGGERHRREGRRRRRERRRGDDVGQPCDDRDLPVVHRLQVHQGPRGRDRGHRFVRVQSGRDRRVVQTHGVEPGPAVRSEHPVQRGRGKSLQVGVHAPAPQKHSCRRRVLGAGRCRGRVLEPRRCVACRDQRVAPRRRAGRSLLSWGSCARLERASSIRLQGDPRGPTCPASRHGSRHHAGQERPVLRSERVSSRDRIARIAGARERSRGASLPG